MDDRELLQWAAKAANYPVEVRTQWIEVQILGQGEPEKVAGESHLYVYGELWNPLTDDGDALRLMARLNINISYRENINGAWVVAEHEDIQFCPESLDGPHEDDATRRAIVRAAAEIGKGLDK